MPARQLHRNPNPTSAETLTPPPPPPLRSHHRHHHHHLPPHLIAAVASLSALFLLALLLLLYLRRLLPLSRHKTAPSSPPSTTITTANSKNPQPPPSPPLPRLRRFTYDQLRLATSNFSPSLKLGQGGFGPVFRGYLPPSSHPVAVKLMSSSSLQGDLEFRNELSLSSSLQPPSPCPLLLPLGFCSHDLPPPSTTKKRKNKKKRRTSRKSRSPNWFDAFDDDDGDDPNDPGSVYGIDLDDDRGAFATKRLLLVYDLMESGSLQDALLVKKSPELMSWGRRFQIALDVARGLLFLHMDCHPPVVHGDIKPSNVLLDRGFRARIADFGLARVLGPGDGEIAKGGEVDDAPHGHGEEGGNEEEEEDLATTVEEEGASLSPELSPMRLETMTTTTMSGSEVGGGLDRVSVESWGWRKNGSETGKDWWWRQDLEEGMGVCGGGGGRGGGRVKDYVMEWIGSEIRKERPANMWEAATSSVSGGGCTRSGNEEPEVPCTTGKKRQHRSLDWWSFGSDERCKKKKMNKPRRPREWWREEFCEELTEKNKKKQAVIIPKSNFCTLRGVVVSDNQWWNKQDEPRTPPFCKKLKKKNSNRGSGSIQYGMELRMPARRSSHDCHSGDIPKSGGISSTPSMRGTVCYSAPECGGAGGEFMSEKCDIYSFGVLLLVIVSGRRPLQVTASPMSQFERANLISWARNLVHRGGNLLDLLDLSLHGVDKEQALLCITVALLCLQRSPAQRPTITEVVEMLSGDLELPQLPVEFAPSPRSAFPFKSRRKKGS